MAKVAFLGLGVMGYPMARHLKAKGHEVTVYNRTTAKAEKWVSQNGGRVGKTPRQAADGQEIVFSCVGNDDDLRQVVLGPDGALAGMKAGAILVDHTTASALVARELHAKTKEKGVGFVDAPVSGGQAGAENGALTVMCGGEPEPYGKVEAVLNVISKGAAGSWQMENRGKTMNQGKFDFGFAVDWMRKDLGICLDEARKNGAQLPVSALVDQFYAEIQKMGGRRWDTSSLIARLEG